MPLDIPLHASCQHQERPSSNGSSSNLALRERKGALDVGFDPDPMRRPSKA